MSLLSSITSLRNSLIVFIHYCMFNSISFTRQYVNAFVHSISFTRGINYDDKCPFLCHNCGYCKYAKFEFIVSSRVCSDVDTLDNDAARQEAILTVDGLLADTSFLYNKLNDTIPKIKKTLSSILSQDLNRDFVSSISRPLLTSVNLSTNACLQKAAGPSSTVVELSDLYSKECKETNISINNNLQRINAYRSEIVRFMSDGGDGADNRGDRHHLHSTRYTSYLTLPDITLASYITRQAPCYSCCLSSITNLFQITKSAALNKNICSVIAETVSNSTITSSTTIIIIITYS